MTLKGILDYLWDKLVRLRTHLVNWIGLAVLLAPDLIGAPEIMAVVPTSYHKYLVAAALVINLVMRPRPAARKLDK